MEQFDFQVIWTETAHAFIESDHIHGEQVIDP